MADEPNKREELKSLRERLYDRSFTPRKNERTVLKPTAPAATAPHNWGQPAEIEKEEPVPEEPKVTKAAVPVEPEDATGIKPIGYYNHTTMPRKRKYRSALIVFGLLFFLITLIVSSGYMFLGGNTISGDNISVSITGPTSVGGGEVMPLQIGVTNQNSAAIKAATLIIRYPLGSQSPNEEGREIQREAIPLESIAAGETINIPIRVVVFGKEDEEQEIQAEVEYQVQGSNGIFFREADPHAFKINSSPVNISIESLEQVSSGQPVDILMIVRSNSTQVLRDLVVRAEYPFGFDYSSSKPEPISGQNVWLIRELQPDETVTISAQGIVVGLPSDERQVTASVGVANDTNAYRLASVFSSADFEFEFEQEFINLAIDVNGSSDETVIVNRDSDVRVNIRFTNPLDDTIYDPELTVELSGTALDESGVEVSNGFYDSIRNTVIFDRNTSRGLEKILPGKTENLNFTIKPDSFVRETPDLGLRISARAKRIQESNVPESLVGSETRTVKFASVAELLSSVSPQSGLIPPVAEKLTQYTISMRVESGSNDLVNGEVTATLPTYVSWLNVSSGDGEMSFRNSSRTVVWDIGSLNSNSAATVSFTVGFLPSISQVGTTPTLLSNQSFKGTDRFTGTVIRNNHPALTTVLSSESGYGTKDGEVRRTENDN